MRLSLITQFKIELLLPFTGYRKVLGKKPDIYIYIFLKTLNGCIKSTTCARPVSLNCFSGVDWKQHLKNNTKKLIVKKVVPFYTLNWSCQIYTESNLRILPPYVYILFICVYIYVYIYIHIYTYIYIYTPLSNDAFMYSFNI